ncbi:hypothetical protein Elgi_52900 [Paenibacillus elgii]|uniref:hypothetical protein n=1 Tax=Paenibacillus elgii TaxID=189691 RepID=UPI002D7D4821|nr:hypothetical protein Elgi_52900 [Paenibacillus elgii]
MDKETQAGIENLETTAEAADLLTVPEGAKDYVDIIGDENLDPYGKPFSNADQL